MTPQALSEILTELSSRPGHEKVRSLIYRLLTDGLGAPSQNVRLEQRMEVSGRVDAMLGRTVIEVKTNLTFEVGDGERQLEGYLRECEETSGQPYVGILTDGAEFSVYALRPLDGVLEQIGGRRIKSDLKPEDNRNFLVWLESVVAVADSLPPEVAIIQAELGRDSPLYARAMGELEALWALHSADPEVALKRDLWRRLLQFAYADDIGGDQLFLQHTYLVIVAKAVATVALFNRLPGTATDLLDGRQFQELGITGAVEGDFFDWLLKDKDGDALVMRIAVLVGRFTLHAIEADVLKGLYESLIDPEQRHDLGEYYTPDWLAARICATVITEPLGQRVIDPACGSGTFLFHAIRQLLSAADFAGLAPAAAVTFSCQLIAGIDVHPVAVIFARATFLLALAPTMERDRPPSFAVPVYLGDALQWNRADLLGSSELEIDVPAVPETGKAARLRFPEHVVSDPGLFDEILAAMIEFADSGRSSRDFLEWLGRKSIESSDATALVDTQRTMARLIKEGRNHIWGYVARNLSRPIWLSGEGQRADVVVGNPPWVRYSSMGSAMQRRFKAEAIRAGLWVGGKSATANDLSALFFARCVSLYMRKGGRIAFVMPYAAMSREPYAKFRQGEFSPFRASDTATVQFTAAWALPSDVTPLFPVPASVLFAERAIEPAPLPSTVLRFSGRLPRRDARPEEAARTLTEVVDEWPSTPAESSRYRERFRQGATLVPRRMLIVERLPAGRLGANQAVPRVKGRTTSLDKLPWKNLDPLEGPVEAAFLRPVWLGESIAPYRPLRPALGVIAYDATTGDMLDADRAARRGYVNLARWLQRGEGLWKAHGSGKMTWCERVDYGSAISKQFPMPHLRVVYAASGSNPAATILPEGDEGIIEHKLYWGSPKSMAEARYLCAVLNSEVTRARAEHWQSEGQFGKRDFDRAALNLPIPEYDSVNSLHLELVAAAERAELIAADIQIDANEKFVRIRKRIRDELTSEGTAGRIDRLVEKLLGKAQLGSMIQRLRSLPAPLLPNPTEDESDEEVIDR